MESCDWPFTAQKRVCGSNVSHPGLDYMVKAANDPYIELSRLTQGTDDLGIGDAAQTVKGVAFTAIGSLITVVAAVAACISKKEGNVSFEQYNETMINRSKSASRRHKAVAPPRSTCALPCPRPTW